MMETVDDCPICEPIKNVLNFLLENGFEMIEKKVSDYHFHELYFKLKGEKINIPAFENIIQHSESKLTCECHWSSIELDITPTVV
ncbi:hypothetical protein [Flagellimonas sp. 2504JD4-2]